MVNYNQHTVILPSVDDVDEATVTKLRPLAGDGHTGEGGAAEVKMCSSAGANAAGALVGDNDSNGSPGADLVVKALNLKAGPTPFPIHEQYRAYRPDPSPVRLHIHHCPVSASSACQKSIFSFPQFHKLISI